MSCTHRTPEYWRDELVEVGPHGETEMQPVRYGGEWTYQDMDVGRFRCTQCGYVGYYTGHWKRYFEEGIPCPGSNGVKR